MENKTMMTDLYELTMAQVYFNSGEKDKIAYFDAFFRREPLEAGYGIMAGVDNEDFLNYLREFKFTGDIYAVPDGTPIFRNEPILTVKAPIIEAQIIETCLLSYLNPSICYATATKKITEVAGEISLMEFGARRAYGPDAAVEASKCAIIGGAAGSSNVLAGEIYKMPVLGTMAHSLVTEADSEYDAFLNFAKTYPTNCVLLIDTYDTLRSGVPNAIRVAKEYLIPNGYELKGVRIDSGDLAYLSKEAKRMFIEAGLPNVQICLSNGLNAETIASLIRQGAVIDSIGLGDNIVAPDNGRVGCVYKNVAIEKDGEIIPKIKVSSDTAKTINPGYKKLYRFYDNETGYALGDLVALYDEVIPEDGYILIDPEDGYILIDPEDEMNFQRVTNYTVRNLQEKIFENGNLVYDDKDIFEKKEYCKAQMKTLYPEIKRTEKPHKYYVDLSEKLLNMKKHMIRDAKTKIL